MVETLWVHLDLVDLVVVAVVTDERGVSAAYMYSARQFIQVNSVPNVSSIITPKPHHHYPHTYM